MGTLRNEAYLKQCEGFINGKERHLVCKLKKLVFRVSQGYHFIWIWITKNVVDQCIYLNVRGSEYIFLVFCM